MTVAVSWLDRGTFIAKSAMHLEAASIKLKVV